VYCDVEGLQPLSGILAQAQRPNLVILDRSVHSGYRISLVKLTFPWDTKAENHKASKYADLSIAYHYILKSDIFIVKICKVFSRPCQGLPCFQTDGGPPPAGLYKSFKRFGIILFMHMILVILVP
jgi:hypothetical protein